MTAQTLTPVTDAVDGAGTDLTALLATPTQTQLQFSNSGRERLLIQATSAGVTVTVSVGMTILGQTVAAFTPVTLTSGDLYSFGRFDRQLDAPGTATVTVTLSTVSNVKVALLQETGVSQ